MTTSAVGSVGLIGLGSIGRRHARILRALEPELTIHALRTRRGALLEPFDSVVDVDRDRFFSTRYDLVVIANPSSLHLDTLRDVLDAEIAPVIVVEKPFCLEGQRAEARRLLDRFQGTRILPGNTLRFHPAIADLKLVILQRQLGSVLECRAHFGTYMPSWHPYEDYRGTYAARRVLGGGVLLTSIHEIDLAHHLFGAGVLTGGYVGQVLLRDTDVEDVAHLLLRLERCPIANISLSFFERPADRSLKVVFERGVWEWRFGQSSVVTTKWSHDAAAESVRAVDPSVDTMYQQMWRAVLNGDDDCFEMASVFGSLETVEAARALSGEM